MSGRMVGHVRPGAGCTHRVLGLGPGVGCTHRVLGLGPEIGCTHRSRTHPSQVYRQLIALRENFDHLIKAVEETGLVRQQQHGLEEKQCALVQRNDGLSMERLEEDAEMIRAENAQLQADIKALRKK